MSASQEAQPLTVSELTQRIKDSLEAEFPAVWVSGELSDVARPQSGHVYVTLKDAQAQIRGVIWRTVAARLKFDLRDGQKVVCQGGLDVYPPRGAYQLIIRQIEPLGLGALQLALRQLHQRLAAEGLFGPSRKRPLPRFPRRVAFVTSPTGAAIRDFLEVARRRWSGVQVLVIPAKVQGTGAEADLVRGIETANRLAEPPDVLVVGRGGGSLEDLWCFNAESVVRAIVASDIPVVSAVGHEIDVTLADLAADVRALTPSEAAERIVPAADQLRSNLEGARQRLVAGLRNRLSGARARLEALAQHRGLRRPYDLVHDLARRVEEWELRASRALEQQRLRNHERLASLAGRLESLSPLAVLQRGYSVTLRAADGQVVRDAASVAVGQRLISRLAAGQVVSCVESVILSPTDREPAPKE